MRVSSSTPAVSPINTPQKKTAPKADTPNDAVAPANTETNGNLSEESDVKELEEDDEDEEEMEDEEDGEKPAKQGEEQVEENNRPANGETTSEEEPTDSEASKENGKRDENDGATDGSLYETVNEPDKSAGLDSMNVEVGSVLRPPDLTVNESSSVESPKLPVTIPESDQIHDKFQWQPSKR